MKKFLSVIALSLCTLALVACGGDKKAEGEAAPAEKKVEARVIKVSTKFVDDEEVKVH